MSPRRAPPPRSTDAPPRERILQAAFRILRERGYAATNTNEIAARARVSKRELYAEFGSKQGIFVACIEARSSKMRAPLDVPAIPDPATLRATLRGFGEAFLRELYHPDVIAMYRLVIASVESEPELSRAFADGASTPVAAAVGKLMTQAVAAGFLAGDPETLGDHLVALLLVRQVWVLLGIEAPPDAATIEADVRGATDAFFQLHAPTVSRAGRSARSST